MQKRDQSVPLDWRRKTLPDEITNECRKIYSQAIGDGWREVTGTIIMDKNNVVVGFRMHFVKDGTESKEVVVPASPELAAASTTLIPSAATAR